MPSPPSPVAGEFLQQSSSPGCSYPWLPRSCRAQRSWGGRRAAQETGKGFCHLLHTPAQHPVHPESFCWGTAALRASPTPDRDPDLLWSLQFAHMWQGMSPYKRMQQTNDSTEKSRNPQNLLLEHLQQDDQPHKYCMRRMWEKVCRVQLSEPG